MQNTTTLLCTFCTTDTLNETLINIVNNFTVVFDSIYVLENVDTPSSLCCTYNITTSASTIIPEATISLHRKKMTNTLYTINALNLLVAELNGGKVDKKFQIPWQEYRNTILVTAYGKLKRINTRLLYLVKTTEIGYN
jgi:hypothetical protein